MRRQFANRMGIRPLNPVVSYDVLSKVVGVFHFVMAHPNYATAVQRRFRTEARIKGLIIALAAYGSGKPNLFTSGPEFKSSVFAVLGGKAAANKLMSQARNWKAPRDANDFKCFQFTSCVRLRLGLLSSTRSSMALTVGKHGLIVRFCRSRT